MNPWLNLQFMLVRLFVAAWVVIGIVKCIPGVTLPADILDLWKGLTYTLLAVASFQEIGNAIKRELAASETKEKTDAKSDSAPPAVPGPDA